MAPKMLLLLCAGLCAGLIVFPRSASSVADVEGDCLEKTPSNFQETFIDNCRNLGESEDNCNAAYSLFFGAFSNRNASEVQRENYNPYFDHLPIVAMQDQSLFWSKAFSLVKVLSMMNTMGVKVVSSETTISGRIINDFMNFNLCWCSSAGNPGLVLDRICPQAAKSLFWAQFSVRFSQAASGTVFFLSDGNKRPAYNLASFFGCYELANLNTTVVKRLVALNVHTKEGESCGTESFNILKENVTSLNLKYTCYDINGNASDDSQTNMIAGCLKKIIGDVQDGTESGTYQVDCSGVKLLEVSMGMIILSFVLSLL